MISPFSRLVPHGGPAGKSRGHSKDKENTTPGRAKMMLVSSGLAAAEQVCVRARVDPAKAQ